MSKASKLAYLRDAIRDPDTQALLSCGSESAGYYDEMIDVLHQRFDQTRVIHAAYCRKLADIAPVKQNKADLSTFADCLYTTVAGLKRTGQFEASTIITSLVASALPKTLRMDWEDKTEESKSVPDIEEFIRFVRRKSMNVGHAPPITTPLEPKRESKPNHKKEQHQRQRATVHVSTAPPPAPKPSPPPSQPVSRPPSNYQNFKYDCILCSVKHPLFLCPRFGTMTVEQRMDHIRAHHLCVNCLAPGHKTADCRSYGRCRTCRDKHNTRTHHRVRQPQPKPVATTSNLSIQASLTMTSQVMLAGSAGRKLVVRAVLDSGASMSLISTKAANTLQLQGPNALVTFSGVQDSQSPPSDSLLDVCMSSLQGSSRPFHVAAAVVPKVTCDLP